jgi:cytochrome c553
MEVLVLDPLLGARLANSMKVWCVAIGVVLLTACQVQTDNSTAYDASLYGPPTIAPGSSQNFTSAQALIVQNCATCHEHSSWSTYQEQDYINNGYVVAGNLSGSAIWTNLAANGGEMPQGGSLSASQVDVLQTWILGISNNGGTQSSSFLQTQAAMQVLSVSCISCHNVSQTSTSSGATVPAFASAVTSFISSGDELAVNQFFAGGVSNLVTEGNASQSWLIESLIGYGTIGTMPYAGTSPHYTSGTPLSASDEQALEDWINGMSQ